MKGHAATASRPAGWAAGLPPRDFIKMLKIVRIGGDRDWDYVNVDVENRRAPVLEYLGAGVRMRSLALRTCATRGL